MIENEMIMRNGLQIASGISQQNQMANLQTWQNLVGFANERRGAGIYGVFQGANAAALGAAATAKAFEK